MATSIKWRGEELKRYTNRQLEASLEVVWILFQKIAREDAGKTNTGQVIKLKGGEIDKSALDYRRDRIAGLGTTKRIEANQRKLILGKRRVQKMRRMGARVPIYIPNVGWRMSKNRRKSRLFRGMANKTQITIYPHSSKPGEPVRRRTGIGQKNIVGGRRGMVAKVGYSKTTPYMTMHELGITYPRGGWQQRPTLVPALWRHQHRLFRAMKNAAQATKP